MGRRTDTHEGEASANCNCESTVEEGGGGQCDGVSRRRYLGAASAALGLTVGPSAASASHDGVSLEPNRPAITAPQPIVEENLTIAHYMTGMVPARTAEYFYSDPAYYDPEGPTSQLGGVMQHALPLALNNQSEDLYEHQPVDLSQKEAIRYEIETAMTFGVDGFDFYYPWVGNPQHQQRYNEDYLPNFFEVVAEEGYDFDLTVAVSHPYQGGTDQRINGIAQNIADLIDRVGADHEAWLTAADGRKIFYTWLPDGITLGQDMHDIPDNPEWMQSVAEGYEAIRQEAGADAMWMYDLHYAADYPGHTDYVDAALDYFPAVKGWITRCGQDEIWDYVAEQCAQRGRTFSQDVFSDFHTGIAYRQEPAQGGIYVPGEAENVSPDQVKKWNKVLDVSRNFRDDLRNVLDRDADMVNLTTWNDYAEGHHLAPEINHNFGFAQLFQHFMGLWRDDPANQLSDVAVAFFKKYPSDATPNYDLGARTDTPCGDPSVEDVIEVVTILDDPAEVQVNDQSPQAVGAGVQATRFEMELGQVDVTVTRNGAEVTSFTTPEAITDEPIRTDRLTFAFSNRHEEIYTDLYGDDPVMVSNQFADSDYADGPNFGEGGDGGGDGGDGGSGTAAPTNLTVTGTTDASVTITWSHPNDGAVSYDVYVDDSVDFSGWGSADVEYTIDELEPGSSHEVYVVANGPDGASDPSETITVTAGGDGGGGDETAPSAPSNLSATGTTSSSVSLDWDASADDGTGVAEYVVYVDGGSDHTVAAGTTSTTVTGLSAETTYEFAVSAVDGAGNESGPSDAVEVTTEAGGSGGPIEEGVYRITPVHSDKAVDVSGISTADGANVHQWSYVGGDNQRFRVEEVAAGEYRLVAQHSDKVLAVESDSTADGATVIQWSWHGSDGQRWHIEHVSGDQYRVVNVNSGKVLDVSGVSTADGADVHQWTDVGGDNQRFRFE